MTEYNNVCYNNSCLNRVIVRFDFFGYIGLDSLTKESLQKIIKQIYPNIGIQQLIKYGDLSINLSSTSEPVENKVVLGNRLPYSDNNGNSLFLSNKSIVFQFDNYQSFEHVKNRVFPIIKELFNIAPSLTIVRSGMRYINLFKDGSIKPLKRYFNSQVSSSLEPLSPSSLSEIEMTRKICLAEFRIANTFLNFRYGYINPDYPQTLRKNDFTLDYDCFKKETLCSSEEIFDFMDNAHYYIQKMFENSITDSLREVIKNV